VESCKRIAYNVYMSRTRKLTLSNEYTPPAMGVGSLEKKLRVLREELHKKRHKSRLFVTQEKSEPVSKKQEKEHVHGSIMDRFVDLTEYPVHIQKKLEGIRSKHVVMLREQEEDSTTPLFTKGTKFRTRTPKVDLHKVHVDIFHTVLWVFLDFFISIPLALLYLLRFVLWVVRILGWLVIKVMYSVAYTLVYGAELVVMFMYMGIRGIHRIVWYMRSTRRMKYILFAWYDEFGVYVDRVGTKLFYAFAQRVWSYKFRTIRTQLAQGWYKKEFIFVVVGLSLIVPLVWARPWTHALRSTQGKVLGDVSDALASHDIHQIRKSFNDASQALHELGPFTRALLGATQVGESASSLIEVGNELSMAGEILAQFQTDLDSPSLSLLDKVERSVHAFDNASPHIKIALKKLNDVDARIVPSSIRPKITLLQEKLPEVAQSLDKVSTLSHDLLVILGKNDVKRYLVVFQNNNELRATGGFMGSLALIDVKNGKITRFEVPGGGTYDFQGQLKAWVTPPQPLGLVSSRWELQDSNWWPSFPDSARKILWFWEKSSGPSVDGVIAINATFMEQVLRVLGPVTLPSTGEQIASDQFIETLQDTIASNRKTKEPKKILSELSPIILDSLLNTHGEEVAALSATFVKALAQKDVLFYFSDTTLQNDFADADLVGAMKHPSQDYLMVVATNIQGGKTDGVITQKVDVDETVTKEGKVFHTLTIHRTHKGDPNNETEKLNNVAYMRIYVPEGSELIDAKGFNPPYLKYFKEPDRNLSIDADLSRIETKSVVDEKTGVRISNELGYTVLGNWMQVEPGGEAIATITYVTPFSIKPEGLLTPARSYSLLIQKQPGMRPQETNVHLTLPQEWQIEWSNGSTHMTVHTGQGSNKAEAKVTLTEDAYFGITFKR